MSESKMDWAMPVMRVGYGGRGLTYLAISGLSLWAIWHGGEAEGTTEALQSVEHSPFGTVILFIIGTGLVAYMIWRLLDAVADLEDYGTDAKGIIARLGMVATGLIHGALGVGAFYTIASAQEQGDGQSSIVTGTTKIMQMPMGAVVVGFTGLATVIAGGYYLHKAWSQNYRDNLIGNHFTTHWNRALQLGVAAQGVTVGVIGLFLVGAAWQSDASQAGGLGQTFAWLSQQTYGQVLVTLLCLGLLAFALFLFVNAVYRYVPRLTDPSLTTLRDKLS